MRKYSWKKILIKTLWLLTAIGAIVLFGAAVHMKNQKKCAEIKVDIIGVEQHLFIDENEVLSIVNSQNTLIGTNVSSINLREMEMAVEKNPWVKNAEIFLDNNQLLNIKIEERQPVARVFTLEGSSFYLDSSSLRLPLSEKVSARLPTFTGFPSNKDKLSKPDSLLLNQIVKLGNFIQADSFWMAQIAQIDITPQANFELVPVIGDHFVVLGKVEDLKSKFNRLYAFYQQAWLQNGINTYEKLDVQYAGQVVAVRKGTLKTMVDSVRVHQLILDLLNQHQRSLIDSSYLNLPAKIITTNPLRDSLITSVLLKVPKEESGQTNSGVILNNNNNRKSLVIKKKENNKPLLKKKPVAKSDKPKALMEKNRET